MTEIVKSFIVTLTNYINYTYQPNSTLYEFNEFNLNVLRLNMIWFPLRPVLNHSSKSNGLSYVHLTVLRGSIDLAKDSISSLFSSCRTSIVAYSRGNCVIGTQTWHTVAFDASNRASKSHVKTNRQNCGRRKVLHETFITSGTGCGYQSASKSYTRTRVCESDTCNRVGESSLYWRLSPVQD